MDKKVDEFWKDSVRKEHAAAAPEVSEAPVAEAVGGFSYFVSGLAMQGMMALGLIQEPGAVAKPQADLGLAKHVIDTLQMLSEKTKGNLTKEEATMLKSALYELQVKFVEQSQSP